MTTTSGQLAIVNNTSNLIGLHEFAEKVIATAKKAKTILSVHDAIVITSEKFNLPYHRGPHEYKQATKAVIKLIRVAKEATIFDRQGKPLNTILKGKFNHLLGTKIAPSYQPGLIPSWAGATKPVRSLKDPVDGTKLNLVQDFKELTSKVLNMGELLNVNVNVAEPEWLTSKVQAHPSVRDTDLKLLISEMNATLDHGKAIGAARTEVRVLTAQAETLLRLVQNNTSVTV